MAKLDRKDCMILNLLQQDCRMSLTKIAKEIELSVDSTKKRIDHMVRDWIFYPKIQIRPRNFGFSNITDVKIKLHNYSKEDLKKFIEYLQAHPRVAEIFSVSGEWDFALVMISKDAHEQGILTETIRNKFSKIINAWSESLTTCVHKFESYDMIKLMEFDKK